MVADSLEISFELQKELEHYFPHTKSFELNIEFDDVTSDEYYILNITFYTSSNGIEDSVTIWRPVDREEDDPIEDLYLEEYPNVVADWDSDRLDDLLFGLIDLAHKNRQYGEGKKIRIVAV